MHEISPIVVGVDGSPTSMRAVRWAAREAALHQVPLSLVTTLLLSPGSNTDAIYAVPGILADQEARGKERLDTAVHLAQISAPGIEISTGVRYGQASASLLDCSVSARMIVLGSRGLGEFTGGLVGSVSTAVSTHALCPVVVIHELPDADEPQLDGPVLVGVDGSAHGEVALKIGFAEASLRGADLVAVHVWSDVALSTVLVTDYQNFDTDWAAVDTAEHAVLSESLAGWSEQYPEVTVRRVVERDRPVRTLVDYAQSAQLTVVGSRGRGGFASMLLGSTSRALLHSVDTPLMIVHGS